MPAQTHHRFQRPALVRLATLVLGVLIASAWPGWQAPLAFAAEVAPATVQADKVRLTMTASRDAVAPGSVLPVAIVMDFDKGWHAWPSADQDVLPPEIAEFAIRAAVTFSEPAPAWARLATIQWPEPKPAPVPDVTGKTKTVTALTYKDRSTIFVPVVIAKDAPAGPARIDLTVSYQACDDVQCLMPADIALSVPITIAADASADIAPDRAALFAAMTPVDQSVIDAPATAPSTSTGDAAIPAPATAAAAPAAGSTFFGISLAGLADSPAGWVALALLAAVGGFILNLTPCVLPVIPIKVLTLTQQAGSPRRSFVLGLWMALGVVAFWLALGVPAAFVAKLADPSQIFGIWWLTTAIGVLIGAMGLGIMGLFNITLPQKVYSVNPEADSPAGSFMFGVMTAVLGLPCFGFVAGALLPTAATIGPVATIVIFGAMGVGMAAPYLVLAAKPEWLKSMPRTGPASDLVKQVMGLLLLAAAAFFIGAGLIALVQDKPYIATRLHWWFVAVFGVLAGALLVFRTFQITPSAGKRAAFSIVGLVLAAGGVIAAYGETIKARADYGVWNEYSEAFVTRAREQGKTVVMDFTAEWCINCKALKAAVLDQEPVHSALRNSDTVLVKVDLTSRNAPGWDALRALGQTGIPLLAVKGPALPEPWLSNAYTSDQVMDALTRARKAP